MDPYSDQRRSKKRGREEEEYDDASPFKRGLHWNAITPTYEEDVQTACHSQSEPVKQNTLCMDTPILLDLSYGPEDRLPTFEDCPTSNETPLACSSGTDHQYVVEGRVKETQVTRADPIMPSESSNVVLSTETPLNIAKELTNLTAENLAMNLTDQTQPTSLGLNSLLSPTNPRTALTVERDDSSHTEPLPSSDEQDQNGAVSSVSSSHGEYLSTERAWESGSEDEAMFSAYQFYHSESDTSGRPSSHEEIPFTI